MYLSSIIGRKVFIIIGFVRFYVENDGKLILNLNFIILYLLFTSTDKLVMNNYFLYFVSHEDGYLLWSRLVVIE